jgi:hypothetical protein
VASDRAVSRGPAGDFAYDFGPMRDHAAKVHRTAPRSAVRYICPRNNVAIAGMWPPDPDGTVIEFEIGSGFLNRPWQLK